MEKTLGQPIAVEDRPGGNGAVGTGVVAKAVPDGYTLVMTSGSILTVMPWMVDLGFDPLDLSFIGSTHESLHVQLARGDSPWKTIQEMVAWAKANPGKLVHATSGGFGINDIGMAQLAKAAGGFEYRTLPTGGGAEQILKLLAGDAQTEQNSAAPSLPHIRTGAVRPLLILTPSWPELEKMGVPLSKDVYGFTVRNLSSLAGPPGLPEDIRRTLEDALRSAMADKNVMEQMQRVVGELIVYKTGAQIREEVKRVQAEHRAIGEQLGKLKPK
jgi:tripartite-type tricarboxylate transporter receptor subunit TctC